MTYRYALYGLVLEVPFPCPGVPVADGVGPADIVVTVGRTPRSLDEAVISEPQWDAAAGRFLWRGGRWSGRFLAESGCRVTVQINPDAEPERLAAHLLDAVLAALLRQRGLVVLHANAVLTPRGVVCLAGQSGAGKSTTSMALTARGCSLLADDIAVVQLGQGGQLEVLAGAPHVYLTEESAAGLGRDLAGLPRDPTRRHKAAVPAAAAPVAAAPLRAIFWLETHPGEGLRVELISGRQKFMGLQDCLYGPLVPDEAARDLVVLTRLAAETPLVRIQRPGGAWTAEQVVDVILNG